MTKPFANESLTDFGVEANAQAFRAALDKVRAGLGRAHPLIIGGEKIFTDDVLESRNPAEPSQIVGRVSQATPELADRAVREAFCAFEHWKRVPYSERARYLFHAAKLMRERKHEFSALMVFEEASPGWKPMRIQPKRSISWNSTVARCFALGRLIRPCPSLTTTLSCTTSRWAWAS
jgi:1-pyrroline-5-carboxylate dehydrogenase